MIDVSIILVNYNTKDLLINCIDSIFEKTIDISYEIIIVDNDSHDGTENAIKRNFPDINFIQSGANIGFGRANNLGIEEAKGEFIFLLNSDTILINNAVKILYDYINKNPNVGICGGNLYNLDHKPTISFGRCMPGIIHDLDSLFGGVYSRIIYGKNIFYNHNDKPMIINGYISGADMMIRKEVLDELGVFDSDFFMYYEETELTWRIRKAGYTVVSLPGAKIIHLEGASETIKENTARRMIKSKFLYFKKTKKSFYSKISFFIFLLTAWSRMLVFFILRKINSVNYWRTLLKINKEEYGIWIQSNNK